ncbi:MAG: hypothetical protein H0X29_01065 [Parachlamydiaceae bacterium]|nr:hypothetical protein [Parachlamydiaceae bacterium]
MSVQESRNLESIGFINHAHMAFTSDPEGFSGKNYNQNSLEKVGGMLNWCVTTLPKKAWHALHNPKVLTVAFTALALLTVQFTFYPTATYLATKAICIFIATHIPAYAVKISAYVFIQMNVLGFGLKALGRFSNEELMNNWYNKPENHNVNSI